MFLELENQIRGLPDNQDTQLEYGDQSDPLRYTFLRIRYLPTAGGMQFCLRIVNSIGQEGSGIYSTSPSEICHHAMKEVDRVNRPLTNPRLRPRQPASPRWYVTPYTHP